MEFENLLTLIKTVSESELTSFTMKDGDLKISMGKEKQVVVEQTGMQVMPAVAGNADTVSAGSGSFNGKQEQQEEPAGRKDSKGSSGGNLLCGFGTGCGSICQRG